MTVETNNEKGRAEGQQNSAKTKGGRATTLTSAALDTYSTKGAD